MTLESLPDHLPEVDQEQLRFWYQVGLTRHDEAMNAIGQRNTPFVAVQSILLVALATFIGVPLSFPYAFPGFTILLGVGGSLLCYYHFNAGQKAVREARRWVTYLDGLGSLFPQTRIVPKSSTRLGPHAWVTNARVFAVAWFIVLSYLLTRLLLVEDPTVKMLADVSRGSLPWLHVAQAVSMACVAASSVFCIYLWTRRIP